MEEDSFARRERLKALRAAKELMDAPEEQQQAPAEDSSRIDGGGESAFAKEESIEQAAAARQERLKALRTAKELLRSPDEDSLGNNTRENASEETEEEKALNVKFRNYLPHDKNLQEGKLSPAVLPKFEDPIATAPPSEKSEDPFVNIAPKKPNWDLKRDIQKKLDKLERRTQKALYLIMQEQEKEREALEGENGVAD